MNFNFQGVDTDFRNIFYTYAVDREGYRTDVYKDIKGLPTVGVGHLVRPEDNLEYKDIISKDQVLQYFYEDYDNLNIDSYIQEGAQNYNQALAIAHFIWGHGEGAYKDSTLRQHVLHKDVDLTGMLNYLSANWDKASSTNQKVNKYDFTVYFSPEDWQPSKSMDYYLSQLNNVWNTATQYARQNPTDTVLIITGTAVAISGYIYWLIKKKKIK